MIYGLTKQTVLTYSEAVRYGLSWEHAMQQLRELYEHNKNFVEAQK